MGFAERLRGVALVVLLGIAMATPVSAPAQPPSAVPQIPRDGWKDCAFNDTPIGCVDEQLADGFRLRWRDGLQMTYRRLPRSQESAHQRYRDRLGGVWQEELFPQGNRVLTNLRNGNRILLPLRYPCRPPLKGEVGYCQWGTGPP